VIILPQTVVRGKRVFYTNQVNVIDSGSAMVSTVIDLSWAVPAAALTVQVFFDAQLTSGSGGGCSSGAYLQIVPNYNFAFGLCWVPGAFQVSAQEFSVEIPNIDQKVYYLWYDMDALYIARRLFTLFVQGYTLP